MFISEVMVLSTLLSKYWVFFIFEIWNFQFYEIFNFRKFLFWIFEIFGTPNRIFEIMNFRNLLFWKWEYQFSKYWILEILKKLLLKSEIILLRTKSKWRIEIKSFTFMFRLVTSAKHFGQNYNFFVIRPKYFVNFQCSWDTFSCKLSEQNISYFNIIIELICPFYN